MIVLISYSIDFFFYLSPVLWANRAYCVCLLAIVFWVSIGVDIFTNRLHDMFQSPHGSFRATGAVPCTAWSLVRSAIGVATTDDHSVSVTDSFPYISYFVFDCFEWFILNIRSQQIYSSLYPFDIKNWF